MRNFFENLSYRLSGFMRGRYGRDKLYNVFCIVALVMIILSFIRPLHFFIYLALAVLIFTIYRALSKNIQARQKELEVYERIEHAVTGRVRILRDQWKYRDTHLYVKCPSCKTYIRIKKPPKGKTIRINCPKCGNTIEKRT